MASGPTKQIVKDMRDLELPSPPSASTSTSTHSEHPASKSQDIADLSEASLSNSFPVKRREAASPSLQEKRQQTTDPGKSTRAQSKQKIHPLQDLERDPPPKTILDRLMSFIADLLKKVEQRFVQKPTDPQEEEELSLAQQIELEKEEEEEREQSALNSLKPPQGEKEALSST